MQQVNHDNRTLITKWTDAYERQLFLERCATCDNIDYIADDTEDEQSLNSLGCFFLSAALFMFGVAVIVGLFMLVKHIAL